MIFFSYIELSIDQVMAAKHWRICHYNEIVSIRYSAQVALLCSGLINFNIQSKVEVKTAEELPFSLNSLSLTPSLTHSPNHSLLKTVTVAYIHDPSS